jgi:hypothetical protein
MTRFRLNLRLTLADSCDVLNRESSLIPDANADEEAIANSCVRAMRGDTSLLNKYIWSAPVNADDSIFIVTSHLFCS